MAFVFHVILDVWRRCWCHCCLCQQDLLYDYKSKLTGIVNRSICNKDNGDFIVEVVHSYFCLFALSTEALFMPSTLLCFALLYTQAAWKMHTADLLT